MLYNICSLKACWRTHIYVYVCASKNVSLCSLLLLIFLLHHNSQHDLIKRQWLQIESKIAQLELSQSWSLPLWYTCVCIHVHHRHTYMYTVFRWSHALAYIYVCVCLSRHKRPQFAKVDESLKRIIWSTCYTVSSAKKKALEQKNNKNIYRFFFFYSYTYDVRTYILNIWCIYVW